MYSLTFFLATKNQFAGIEMAGRNSRNPFGQYFLFHSSGFGMLNIFWGVVLFVLAVCVDSFLILPWIPQITAILKQFVIVWLLKPF